MSETETDYPKVTIIPSDDDSYSPRVFVGEDEFPFEVWTAKTHYYSANEHKVTLEFPASAVEFKKVD